MSTEPNTCPKCGAVGPNYGTACVCTDITNEDVDSRMHKLLQMSGIPCALCIMYGVLHPGPCKPASAFPVRA